MTNKVVVVVAVKLYQLEIAYKMLYGHSQTRSSSVCPLRYYSIGGEEERREETV